MKQKYHIWKNSSTGQWHIKEYAVTTADTGRQKNASLQNEYFSLLSEQSYPADDVAEAILKGKDALIGLLRSSHFFPTGVHMNKIAEQVMSMDALQGDQQDDLIVDDKEQLAGNLEKAVNAGSAKITTAAGDI